MFVKFVVILSLSINNLRMDNYKILRYNHSSEIIKDNINEFWLCRMQNGSARVLFENEIHKVASDTVFVVQEGASFRVASSSRNMQLEVLVFNEQLMNVVYSLLGAEADFGSLETIFWANKELDEPFGKIMSMDYESLQTIIQQQPLVARHKMVVASLVHLLLALYNAADDTAKPLQYDNSKRPRMLLNHFFELVSENIMMGHKSVSFYAKKLCISERYLSKLCKAETGQTPKDLINQSLIGEIKNALLTSEMTHQQISDRFGFPDQSAFGQFFKRQEGISPSEFRRKYK